MELEHAGPLVARHECLINASRQRVWDALAGNVIQSMPIEQMDFLNETTLVAVLKFKLGFVAVPVPLRIEIADISPVESFTTLVKASKAGVSSVLRVTYRLAAVTDEQTSVMCDVVEESGSSLMRLLRWQQRRFAGQIFGAVKDRLERSCGD
jgi:hypothetical protein